MHKHWSRWRPLVGCQPQDEEGDSADCPGGGDHGGHGGGGPEEEERKEERSFLVQGLINNFPNISLTSNYVPRCQKTQPPAVRMWMRKI